MDTQFSPLRIHFDTRFLQDTVDNFETLVNMDGHLVDMDYRFITEPHIRNKECRIKRATIAGNEFCIEHNRKNIQDTVKAGTTRIFSCACGYYNVIIPVKPASTPLALLLAAESKNGAGMQDPFPAELFSLYHTIYEQCILFQVHKKLNEEFSDFDFPVVLTRIGQYLLECDFFSVVFQKNGCLLFAYRKKYTYQWEAFPRIPEPDNPDRKNIETLLYTFLDKEQPAHGFCITSDISNQHGYMGMLLACSTEGKPFRHNQQRLLDKLAAEIASVSIKRGFSYTTRPALRAVQVIGKVVPENRDSYSQALIRQEDKKKSELINTLAHELKTPLTTMRIYCELLIKSRNNTQEKRIVQQINQLGQYFERIINRHITFSWIESGKIIPQFKKLQINRCIERTIALLMPVAKDKQINIKFEKKKHDDVYVHADEDLITEVLINLIENAIKFTRKGGENISVRLMEKNESCVISILDKGVGISPEAQQKIFNKYEQGDQKAFPGKVSGSGLGLSIVKYIIEAHKGTIELKSQIDKGSCFSFTLYKNPEMVKNGESR